jgi:hypothetical protein
MLGLIAVLIVGGFVFYTLSRQASLATDSRPDARQPVTTGAGPSTLRDTGTGVNPPAAQQPAPAPQQ